MPKKQHRVVTRRTLSGPKEAALLAWLSDNPWLKLREDGRDYARDVAERIAREASLASGETIPERFVAARWKLGRLWRLQMEAFIEKAS